MVADGGHHNLGTLSGGALPVRLSKSTPRARSRAIPSSAAAWSMPQVGPAKRSRILARCRRRSSLPGSHQRQRRNRRRVGLRLRSPVHLARLFWNGFTMKDLGTLTGGVTSMANSINSSGVIVGQSDGSGTRGHWHAACGTARTRFRISGFSLEATTASPLR